MDCVVTIGSRRVGKGRRWVYGHELSVLERQRLCECVCGSDNLLLHEMDSKVSVEGDRVKIPASDYQLQPHSKI